MRNQKWCLGLGSRCKCRFCNIPEQKRKRHMEGFIVADNVIFRLVLAALLGFVLGIEREVKRKQLGLKTILVISIVSCLLTVVSIESVYRFPDASDIMLRVDRLRLAAQIVSRSEELTSELQSRF